MRQLGDSEHPHEPIRQRHHFVGDDHRPLGQQRLEARSTGSRQHHVGRRHDFASAQRNQRGAVQVHTRRGRAEQLRRGVARQRDSDEKLRPLSLQPFRRRHERRAQARDLAATTAGQNREHGLVVRQTELGASFRFIDLQRDQIG